MSMPEEALCSRTLTGVTLALREELPVSSERIAEMEKSPLFLLSAVLVVVGLVTQVAVLMALVLVLLPWELTPPERDDISASIFSLQSRSRRDCNNTQQ